MKQRIIILLFGLGIFLGPLVLSGSTAQPVQAESAYQDISCDELLTRILVRAGWESINQPFSGCEYLGVGSGFYITAGLSIDTNDGSPYVVRICNDDTVPPCNETTFHGYPAITAISNGTGSIGWTMPRGGTEYRFYIFVGEGYDVMQFAEEILSAAESELPSSDQSLPEPGEPPAEPVQSDHPCADVTPEDFRIGSLESVECRLLCDQAFSQTDDELWACISYYGGQSGGNVPAIPGGPTGSNQPEGNVPTPPEDQTGSDQPGSLGPLATTPLVPLAGALIGTLVGWLVSVAVTSGNDLKPLAVPPLRPVQPPAIAADPNTASPSVAQTPPQPKTPTPPIDSAKVQPSAKPADAPKSRAGQVWDIVLNLTGSSSTVIGSLSEFCDFQDGAKTIQKIQNSLRVWENNPTKEAADAYFKNLRSMTNANEVLEKASKVLGNVANVLDGVDAVAKGWEKGTERGYKGSDKVLAVGAEISKKALNYALTKNPVAGLVNAAVGGITEMAYGKDGRIDVGSIIDKGADAWDNTTQEYAGYTGGDWFAPKNKDFGDVLANDPELRRKDQYLHGLRQIKKLVGQGKISLQEGGARIRHLRDAMSGGE